MEKKSDFPVYASIVDGFKKYNLEVDYYDKSANLETILQDNKDADLFVGMVLYKHIFSLNDPNVKRLVEQFKIKFLSIESGYGYFHWTTDTLKYRTYALCYNGMNGEASFIRPEYSNEKQSTAYPIKPWRSEDKGEYVLICQQRSGDCTLKSKNIKAINISKWTEDQVQKYKNLGYKTRIRPRRNQERSIEEDFKYAKFVVTCSSNSGVLSVLEGVPTVATYPMSMVYDICKNTKTPDRTQWLKDLSYCHWTLEEITNGEPWSFLKNTDFKSILKNV